MLARLQRFSQWLRSHRRLVAAVTLLLAGWYWFCLPKPLFRDPTSIVLEDRLGELLGARIAADGQWRFPEIDSMPPRFASAIVAFEDQRFYRHPGVDLLALGRAMVQNLRSGRIVSGGSTLTMQVIRLARHNPPRTIVEKIIEMILATRLELTTSKDRILAFYASHAPFGGNVVGLEAAAWRYYSKRPALLSWGEAATLAVLPNSPALIHPGRNRSALLAKRNRLLDRLLEQGLLDSLDWELAREEELPSSPTPLPQLAPHLLERAAAEQLPSESRDSRLRTTIDWRLQNQLNTVVARHHQILRNQEIHNLAAFIIDVENNQVLAYTGNAPDAGTEHAEAVDIITAPRSTGSIIKPILYALNLQEGHILPGSLLSDAPAYFRGFRPENFNRQFDGAVAARRALARSLNIPFVNLLKDYGVDKFHFRLRELGLTTITQPPNHYGLSLILGGAEGTLWDIANVYAAMSRSLNHYPALHSRYNKIDRQPATYLLTAGPPSTSSIETTATIGAAAAWFTFQAMQELERPDSEGDWDQFASSRQLAWKTGTSFGFRDAWAIGLTPRYVIAVWAGNADGEGRPSLIGVKAAAPVLFDLIDLLPGGDWFEPPYDDMIQLPVCRQSGFRALDICPSDTLWMPQSGVNVPACPYHQTIHLSSDRQWQVGSDCESPENMIHQSWFVLPPLEEHYYQSKNPAYRPLPPFRSDCDATDATAGSPMQFIYPPHPTRIYVPIDLDGQPSRTIFKVAHRKPESSIFWHLDEEYLGQTQRFHEMELRPTAGKHLLTLVDAQGNRLSQYFEIISKE